MSEQAQKYHGSCMTFWKVPCENSLQFSSPNHRHNKPHPRSVAELCIFLSLYVAYIF